jgi:hypothetical protein
MKWAIHKNETAVAAALALCKGCYQRDVVNGYEALSGSTLRGKARRYGGRYAASRDALLARLRAAGVPVGEERQARGKRVLVIG